MTWEVTAYKGLFMKTSVLGLEFDIGQPWFDTIRLSEDVFLIDRILLRLTDLRSAMQ